MNDLILGIIIGMVIWQLNCMICLITMSFSKKNEKEITALFGCGIFYPIFIIILQICSYIIKWYINKFHVVVEYHNKRYFKEDGILKKDEEWIKAKFRVNKFLLKKYKIGKDYFITTKGEDYIYHNWLEVEERKRDNIYSIGTLKELGTYVKNNVNKNFKKY